MAVPNTFASATSAIPLANLDANFTYYDTAYSITGTTVAFAGNITVTGTTTLTGVATLTANPVLSAGTANGVTYLNGSKSLTSGTGLVFDGTNLGIGITPSYKLHVYNNAAGIASFSQINDSGTALGINNFVMRNANDGDSRVSQFALQVQNTVGNNQQAFIAAQAVTGAAAYSPSMIFGQTTGASTYTERMRIDSSGYIQTPAGTSTLFGVGVPASNTTGGDLTIKAGNSLNTGTGGTLYLATGRAGGSSTVNGAIVFGLGYSTWLTGVVTEYGRFDVSGNLGIGTTSPSYKLDINGSAAQARLQSISAASNAELIFQSTVRTWGIGTNIGTTSSFEIYDRTASATRLTIDSSGNVGIGTTSPSSKLYTQLSSATAYSSGVTGNGLTIYNSSATTGQYVGITLQGEPTTGNGGLATIMGTTTGSGNMDLTFSTRGSATLAERMRIDSSGNVSVTGVASTRNMFQVGSANSTLSGWILGNNSAGTGGIWSTSITPSGTNYTVLADGGGTTLNATTQIVFGISNSEKMRIDSSGNVGINTTSTTANKVRIDSNCNSLTALEVRDLGTTGGTFISFYNSAGNNCGGIVHNGTTTVNYATSSDYRMKEDVQPMTNSLSKVALLKPVTYKWKEEFGGENGQGFIAHELQAVVPDCVSGEKDAVDEEGNPKYQGIDTSFLVATLTAAIQEQQALITALTARITALESN